MVRLLLVAPLLLVILAVSIVRIGGWRRGAREPWRESLTRQLTIAAYVAAGLLSAALFPSFWEATRSANQHCPRDGKCAVEVTPLGEWIAAGPFRAAAESDEACRATVWCTAVSMPTEGESHPLRFGVRNPPVGLMPEGCKAPCALGGKCSAVAGACQTKTDADCALTESCVLWGNCSASGGGCFPAGDDDCAGSRACRVLGRCRAIGGACRAADHMVLPSEEYVVAPGEMGVASARSDSGFRDEVDRCRHLEACPSDGQCDVSAAGDCVVGRDEDCRSSLACVFPPACRRWSDNHQAECAASCADTTLCKEHGRCTPMAPGLCGSGEASDCEASDACRLDGRCALVDGTCQATAQICATWEGCLFDGRCGVTAGECRLTEGSCAHTIPCAKLGACSASTTWEGCGVGTRADCAGSEACKKYGWCRAIGIGYRPMTTSRWFCFSEPER